MRILSQDKTASVDESGVQFFICQRSEHDDNDY